MNEEAWLAGKNPDGMLRHLCGKRPRNGLLDWLGIGRRRVTQIPSRAPERKLRLLACAFCQRLLHLLPSEGCAEYLDAAEAFAAGLLGEEALSKAELAAQQGLETLQRRAYGGGPQSSRKATTVGVRIPGEVLAAAYLAARGDPEEAIALVVEAATEHALGSVDRARSTADALGATARVYLMWEIFGNPFWTPEIDPAWLTQNDGRVRKVAEVIYAERAFDLLPQLADALEEVGCTEPDILAHCRQDGEHVRGCWVVDLLR